MCWYNCSHMGFVFLCVCGPPQDSLTLSWPWLRLFVTLQTSGDTTPNTGMSHAIKNQLILIRDKCQTLLTDCARCLFFSEWAEIPKCDSGELTSLQTEEVSLLIFSSQTSHLLVCQVNKWFLLCTLQPPHETSVCVCAAASRHWADYN